MPRPSRRAVAVLSLAVAACLSLAGPAEAAGTGDVELVPAGRDGQPQTSFLVTPDQDSLTFTLVNLSDEPRTTRLYAASAERAEGGGTTVGADGSAPWLEVPVGKIELAGGESRTVTAPLDASALPPERQQLGAVVLEADQGAVTVRVATLVTVEPRPELPLPLWAVALAVTALVLGTFGLVVARRRRPDEQVDEPEHELVLA